MKPTLLMVKIHEPLNAHIWENRIDSALTKGAKFKAFCYFFESPEMAVETLKKTEGMLGKDDECFIVPIDAAGQTLAFCSATSSIDLHAVGLTSFCMPFLTPGRGAESRGTPPMNQPPL